MVNMRLTGNKEELEALIGALGRLECVKDSAFSSPKKGGNPRYKNDTNLLSYGTLSIDMDTARAETAVGAKVKKLKGIAERAKRVK